MLRQLPQISSPDLLVGPETGDDAAVYRLREDLAIVQTLDFFPPIVDDPYHFGAIAVSNAAGDIYAMGGVPLLGLNIVGFPRDAPREILVEILKGGYDKAAESGMLIVGGHTIADEEPKYGLAITGLIHPGKQVTNAHAQPGDQLVLTKPLGTGIITTAGKNQVVNAGVLANAIATMELLNRGASEAMVCVGVNACTDITGFGLLGHLKGMMAASGTGARIVQSQIPVLPGTWELAARGIAPSGTLRNLKSLGQSVQWEKSLPQEAKLVLADAQTSGGLLMSVPPGKLKLLMQELEKHGVSGAAVIGAVDDSQAIIQILP